MTLMKSISGIRGTIGNTVGDNLTPIDIVKFSAAYGAYIKENAQQQPPKVVIGRDARISGEMVQNLVQYTLVGMGIDVVDLRLSTTPTVEVMVHLEQADGGIILTASHNPKQWNALKLLNNKGEFLDADTGNQIIEHAEGENFSFAEVDDLGTISVKKGAIEKHIEMVLQLPLVDVNRVKNRKFKVVVDAVNSTGGIAVPMLLEKMGVEVVKLYCEPNGHFPHNPEPLKEHLGELCERVVAEKADLGITVDPDVDRLAFVSENGEMFGEEYTLVAVADFVLSKTPGATVSNLSSSRALKDVTANHNQNYEAAAVGEVNVVELMKKNHAIIGGEGNGGIIYPEIHYGRDALVGIALFLTHLAEKNLSISALRAEYPAYFMCKKKIDLNPSTDVDNILNKITEKYKNEQVTTIDGVKIDFENHWIHLRKSNTEPIIRIYTEAQTQEKADAVADDIIEQINHFLN